MAQRDVLRSARVSIQAITLVPAMPGRPGAPAHMFHILTAEAAACAVLRAPRFRCGTPRLARKRAALGPLSTGAFAQDPGLVVPQPARN